MEQFARPPQELSSDGPMDVNWRNWKQQFLIFLKASGAANKDQDYKASLLMNLMGSVGQQVFQNFQFDSPSDQENMDKIIEKFDNHYDPKKSEAYERNVFWTSRKKNEESIDQYVTELKIKAKTCNFGYLTDSIIRDKIILDMRDKLLKEYLLNEHELDLNQTILSWQKHEQTVEKIKQLQDVKKPFDNNHVKGKGSGETSAKTKNTPSSSKTDQPGKKPNANCWRCGTRHPMNNCPAWGKKCGKCGAVNHFTQYCGNGPPPKNNSKDKMNTQLKNLTDGPFNQIPAKVMNKDAAFKNNK